MSQWRRKKILFILRGDYTKVSLEKKKTQISNSTLKISEWSVRLILHFFLRYAWFKDLDNHYSSLNIYFSLIYFRHDKEQDDSVWFWTSGTIFHNWLRWRPNMYSWLEFIKEGQSSIWAPGLTKEGQFLWQPVWSWLYPEG